MNSFFLRNKNSNNYTQITFICAYKAKDINMTSAKKPAKLKQLKAELSKDLIFLKNILSAMPVQKRDNEENMDYEIVNENENKTTDTDVPKRARSIAELEEKLQKIKSQHNFNLKNKLVKKSLNSKLNKKIKKKERMNKKPKPTTDNAPLIEDDAKPDKVKQEKKPKLNAEPTKPVFNTDGKLVFSKFDFANTGQKERVNKAEKDPKKILENLKQQEEMFKQLQDNDDGSKVKQLKEKLAWKTVLHKAEGQKVKDDPILLKKSIKKTEQKKKQSKKQWDTRIQNVEQKKEDRQKKRKENISKKKKEKKSKVVKASAKRGRIVI